MEITARVDYALRALVELAEQAPGLLSRDQIAQRQAVPTRYLEAVLADLRRGGFVVTHRGASGGFSLARPASQITVADVARCVDGPLALVHRARPEHTNYPVRSESLTDLWVAVRSALRSVLEAVTVEHILDGALPEDVRDLIERPGARQGRELENGRATLRPRGTDLVDPAPSTD